MTKVDFTQYEGKFSKEFFTKLKDNPESITVEMMRENLYGYTSEEGYKQGKIPDELMMDYWEDLGQDFDVHSLQYFVFTPQELLFLKAIESTGDGKTPETAFCVIHVHQEYEYMKRVYPYYLLHIKRQSLSQGIDCIEFEPNRYGIDCLYFDVHRLFELFYGS